MQPQWPSIRMVIYPNPSPAGLEGLYPVPLTPTLETLGMEIDRHFTLDEYFAGMLTRAQTRQALLSKIGNTSWRMEVGVLAMTPNAIVGSFLRDGLTLIGGRMPPDLLPKLDAQITNFAATRVGGADRSMCAAALHFLAGAQGITNCFVTHCADQIGSVFRAATSDIAKRLNAQLRHIKRPERRSTASYHRGPALWAREHALKNPYV